MCGEWQTERQTRDYVKDQSGKDRVDHEMKRSTLDLDKIGCLIDRVVIVEVLKSIQGCRELYSYVHKLPDRIIQVVVQHDLVRFHVDELTRVRLKSKK